MKEESNTRIETVKVGLGKVTTVKGGGKEQENRNIAKLPCQGCDMKKIHTMRVKIHKEKERHPSMQV